MTKLPNCPACESDELWRVPGKEVWVRCYECGWDSGPISLDGGRLTESQAIEATVIGVGMAVRSMQAFNERVAAKPHAGDAAANEVEQRNL